MSLLVYQRAYPYFREVRCFNIKVVIQNFKYGPLSYLVYQREISISWLWMPFVIEK